jgi:hypothetical protein
MECIQHPVAPVEYPERIREKSGAALKRSFFTAYTDEFLYMKLPIYKAICTKLKQLRKIEK